LKDLEKEHERLLSEIDRRKMKRIKDMDEFKVIEGVIDPPTLKSLYRLLNRGTIKSLYGVISTGKEANVYRGEDSEGKSVAVKIYRMSTAETDYMLEYIVGDPRFKKVGRRNRVLIPQWAMKEYKNLSRYHEAGVRVPEPIDIERNVLAMEFVGDQDQQLPAPLLKNSDIDEPAEVFNDIVEMIETGYKQAKIVHADLSEYNILWYGEPVIIDVSQGVLKSHPHATKYLLRDIQNIINYFAKLGVESVEAAEIARHIIGTGED
jgi:RIO kinase 1